MSQNQSNHQKDESSHLTHQSDAREKGEALPESTSRHPVHYSKERDELPPEDEIRIENLENEGGPPLD